MESNPQTFGQYLKAYFKNIGQLLKHPAALLPTVLITAVWLVLGFLKKGMKESALMATLNFLTFAQGGIFGGLVGAIGGIIGKILVAGLVNALLLPLFVKGARPMARFKSGFRSFGKSFALDSAGALAPLLGGFSLALFLYSFLNITQRWQEGLVGVTAAVLIIRSIGQKGGFLFSLFYSFLKGRSKDRLPSQAGITRFLSGMTLGFTAGTALNLLGLRWAILVALIALVPALLLGLFARSRRAATLTCMALLAFIPLSTAAPQTQADRERASREYADILSPLAQEMWDIVHEIDAATERGDEDALDEAGERLEAAQKRYYETLDRLALQGSPDAVPSASPEDGEDEADDVDWEDSGREPDSAFEDFIFHSTEAITHGWTDEWDHTHDKGTVTLIDIISGAGAAAGAAGAAAGGAGVGAAGGGPDFPGGEEPDWDAEKREEDEPGTEGGGEPEEEEDDYDYEAEREARRREQEEINRRYGQAHRNDWEKFSTTSDQERINREAEEAMREEEKLERYRQILREEEEREENLKHVAERQGVSITDENGRERDIWDIEHDTKKAILSARNKGLYQDSLDIHKIASDVELECSEKIAQLEVVDKVSDGTVNVLAEIVPGGKKVKDGRDLLKSTLVGASEAYAEGRSVLRGTVGGLAEGVVTVAQNHIEDASKKEGLTGMTKILYEDAANVELEGGKKLLNDMISGKFEKDPNASFENAQKAMVKKTAEIGVGKLTGGNNIATELIMKGHDEITFGEGDDAKTLSDTITGTINDAKNSVTANVMYYTGMY